MLGTHEDPTEVWRGRAAAIRQRQMRSESDGHLAASSFPGLAVKESQRTGSLRPLVATVANRYHPGVDAFLAHAEEVRERTGWSRSFTQQRVERISSCDGGFELDGEGPFAHVLVATGHPGLARPSDYPNAVHAYEPHEYASRVAIVGAGMAAATEWLNALAAGAEVVSIRRREPLRRPLNVPRPFFSKRGLAVYHALSNEQRAAKLRELSAPSFPPGPAWDEPLVAGRARRPLPRRARPERRRAGDLRDGLPPRLPRGSAPRAARRRPRSRDGRPLDRPRERLDRPVAHRRHAARSRSPASPRQWAFPAADTIAGAKYAARAYLRRICRTR